MTDQTAEAPDPAELERRFIEGEDIAPEEIEAAERQSRWARLKAEREQRAAEKVADDLRDQAIADYRAEMAEELPKREAAARKAYDEALAAQRKLVAALTAYNAPLGSEAERRFTELDAEVSGNKRLRALADGFVFDGIPNGTVEVGDERFEPIVVERVSASVAKRACSEGGHRNFDAPASQVRGDHFVWQGKGNQFTRPDRSEA